MKKTQYFVILLAVLLCLSGCYPSGPCMSMRMLTGYPKRYRAMQGWLNKICREQNCVNVQRIA